ncbi:hypothetical protein EJ110_NYTH33812 [Nymphaea thermarum]|nr:hypothetical protein EJ110_NYTH33812 [Nymphaea thermarum]
MELVRKIAGKIRRKKDDRQAEAERGKNREVIHITTDFLEALADGLPVRLEAATDDQQTQEEEAEELNREKYKYRLVGKFCDQHPNIIVLNAKARWLWSVPKRAEPLVVPIGEDTGYYLINTETKKEMKRALKRKPWFFNFQMMRVFRPRNFGPSFDPQLDEAGVHLCWINVPDIPSDYTKEEVVLAVAKQIGMPLKIEFLDESNARLYVAIDVSSQPEMQKEIMLRKIGDDDDAAGMAQRIFYEEDTFPPYCSSCRTMGHAGGEACPFETKWEDKDPSIEEEMGDDGFILYSLHYAGTTMDEASISEAADTLLTLAAGTRPVRAPYNVKYVYKDGTYVGEAQFELPIVEDEFGISLLLGNATPKRYTLENFPALRHVVIKLSAYLEKREFLFPLCQINQCAQNALRVFSAKAGPQETTRASEAKPKILHSLSSLWPPDGMFWHILQSK